MILFLFIMNLFYSSNAWCWYGECCNDDYVIKNFTQLENDLNKLLFGQPLVKKDLVNSLKAHLDPNLPLPPKALVLSLHGNTGTGKNHVSKIVANSLFKNGMNSRFVQSFSATTNFSLNSEVPKYKELIKRLIEEKVSGCKYSLFIFDEMDKIPILLIDVIKQYIDLNSIAHYKNSIFMFLSNSAAHDITQKTFELEHKDNKKRENFELKEFRRIIEKKIFEEKNKVGEEDKGFWHLNLIKAQLIDYYIPFLPLRREHIKMCIQSELKNGHNIDLNTDKKINQFVNHIADELHYEPSGVLLYSQTGCKRIPQLIRSKLVDLRSRDEL